MNGGKVKLPSGEVVSKEFYEKLTSVSSKRPRMVIDKIMKDGSCTTDELIEMGYSHAPRAKRDVVEQGIPIKMKMVKNETTGKKMAKYMFGDWDDYKSQNLLAKTKGRSNLSDKLKQKLISEKGNKCALYGEEFPEALLQTDHRIPFEIGGDPEDMMDTSKFMLLSPSANRAKSWACEHCNNWKKKSTDICGTCYYASPEEYEHIAEREERRMDIIFRENDMDVYNMIMEYAQNDKTTAQEAFKRIVRYAHNFYDADKDN